jgi:nucleotide-binding universal stress UspA family protein
MIKTVLVHLRGTKGDDASLIAALQIARPFGAHLECLHIRPDFAGLISLARPAILEGDTETIARALKRLEQEYAEAAQRASDSLAAFCVAEGIRKGELPINTNGISASFREDIGSDVERLIAHSRRHDLVVVKGGGVNEGGLDASDVGRLILGAGRPALLAPTVPARSTGTVVIAWKDTPEAARAVSAAMPLLEKATRIFVVTASDDEEPPTDQNGVVSHLEWHGLTCEALQVEPRGRDAYDAVLETARSADADLLVAGAYGHGRLREVVFGGFTEGLLEDASLPVLVLH